MQASVRNLKYWTASIPYLLQKTNHKSVDNMLKKANSITSKLKLLSIYKQQCKQFCFGISKIKNKPVKTLSHSKTPNRKGISSLKEACKTKYLVVSKILATTEEQLKVIKKNFLLQRIQKVIIEKSE